MHIYSTWQEARIAARKAKGPVLGYIESSFEPGRYFPLACGARTGVITGPSVYLTTEGA